MVNLSANKKIIAVVVVAIIVFIIIITLIIVFARPTTPKKIGSSCVSDRDCSGSNTGIAACCNGTCTTTIKDNNNTPQCPDKCLNLTPQPGLNVLPGTQPKIPIPSGICITDINSLKYYY
jgi:hypothetical protein